MKFSIKNLLSSKILGWTLFFIVTIIPYFIVGLPPFNDFIGHIYLAQADSLDLGVYESRLQLSYFLVHKILVFLLWLTSSIDVSSALYFSIYSLLTLCVMLFLFKLLKVNRKYFFLLLLYPLGQFSNSYYWGNAPFNMSSMLVMLFLVVSLNIKKLTMVNTFVLQLIVVLAMFAHPTSLIFLPIVLIVLLFKSFIEKNLKLGFVSILLVIEIIVFAIIYRSSLLVLNKSITSIDIIDLVEHRPYLNMLWGRLTFNITDQTVYDFYKLTEVSNWAVTTLKWIKICSFVSTIWFIVTELKRGIKVKKYSSNFYFALYLFIFTGFYFVCKENLDIMPAFWKRVINSYEILRFGLLLYLLKDVFAKLNLVKWSKFGSGLIFSVFSGLCVWSMISMGQNITAKIDKYAYQVSEYLSDENYQYSYYTYKAERSLFYQEGIITAVTVHPIVLEKDIWIKNIWADVFHTPIVFSDDYSKRRVDRDLIFVFDNNDQLELSIY